MSIYLGSNSVDLKLGTKTNLVSAVYLDDLTAYYQKQETFTKDQILSCVNGIMDEISAKCYTKDEISALIESHELEFRLIKHSQDKNKIQLINRANNIITPSCDISCIMPRTIPNQNQLGRDFFIQLYQPQDQLVNVDFVGYEGEHLSFKYTDEIKEMEVSSHYLMWLAELSSGCFLLTQKKLQYLTNSNIIYVNDGNDISTYNLYDNQVNYIELDSNVNLVFPERQNYYYGELIPRDFLVYIKQPLSGEAYDVQFSGRNGEIIAFKTVMNETLNMEVGKEYLFGFGEIKRDELSSEFVSTLKELKNIT